MLPATVANSSNTRLRADTEGRSSLRAAENGTRTRIWELKSVLLALAFCLFAAPAFPDSESQANRLMVEAVQYLNESNAASTAEERYALLKKAHDNLLAIIEQNPSTDLAVKLATGQEIGSISLTSVRAALDRAMNEALKATPQPKPRRQGSPKIAWRMRAGIVALDTPRGKRWAWMVDRDGTTVLQDIETGRDLRTWRR